MRTLKIQVTWSQSSETLTEKAHVWNSLNWKLWYLTFDKQNSLDEITVSCTIKNLIFKVLVILRLKKCYLTDILFHVMLLIAIVNFFCANNFSSTFLTKFRNYLIKIHTHVDLYSLLNISYQIQKLFFLITHWCWPVQTLWVETKWPRGQPVTHWPLWRTSDWVQLVQNLPSLEHL